MRRTQLMTYNPREVGRGKCCGGKLGSRHGLSEAQWYGVVTNLYTSYGVDLNS